MKRLVSTVVTFFGARELFALLIAALIAGSFTVTAFMKGDQQRNKISSNDPTADLWQEISKSQPTISAASGRSVEIQATRFRAFSLNRAAMQRVLAAAP